MEERKIDQNSFRYRGGRRTHIPSGRKIVNSGVSGDDSVGIELQFAGGVNINTNNINTNNININNINNIGIPVQMDTDSALLSPSHIQTILSWLPSERRINAWELSYSLRRDGASLDTLMSLCSSGDVTTSYSVVDHTSTYASRTVSRYDEGVGMALATNISHLIIIEDSWG